MRLSQVFYGTKRILSIVNNNIVKWGFVPKRAIINAISQTTGSTTPHIFPGIIGKILGLSASEEGTGGIAFPSIQAI